MSLPLALALVLTSTAPRLTGTEAELYRLAVEFQSRAETKAAEAQASKRTADRLREDLARCEESQASAAETTKTEDNWSGLEVVAVVSGIVILVAGGVALGAQIR